MLKWRMWVMLTAAFCFFLTGCGKTAVFHFPFALSDVTGITVYHNAASGKTEKKAVTKKEDIDSLYSLFEGLTLSEKPVQTGAGTGMTAFRFCLADGTDYELIYCPIAVKSGRLNIPSEETDYFTSADIGASWAHLDYEAIAAEEGELPNICAES